MSAVDVIAVVAILQYLIFAGLVSRARVVHGVKAPALTGHAQFERIYRVHMNTLELLVAFLPLLYIAAKSWPAWAVSGIGGVYLLGRFVYWRTYVHDPAKRSLGFLLSAGPILVLALASLAAAVLGTVPV